MASPHRVRQLQRSERRLHMHGRSHEPLLAHQSPHPPQHWRLIILLRLLPPPLFLHLRLPPVLCNEALLHPSLLFNLPQHLSREPRGLPPSNPQPQFLLPLPLPLLIPLPLPLSLPLPVLLSLLFFLLSLLELFHASLTVYPILRLFRLSLWLSHFIISFGNLAHKFG